MRPLTTPCSNSDDESPSAISLDALKAPNETEAEKTTREKKNKQQAGCHIEAKHRQQAQVDYEARGVEYDRQCLARKAEEDQHCEDERRRHERHEHEDRIAGSS
jgi:hypothetical protein